MTTSSQELTQFNRNPRSANALTNFDQALGLFGSLNSDSIEADVFNTKARSNRNRTALSSGVAFAGSLNPDSIVFIDRGVENFSQLAAAVRPGVEVVLLDPAQNGIQQISRVLADRRDLSSVHVVANGRKGSLQLGRTKLNANTIDRYTDELQDWAQALTADADALFYGCNVVGNAAGQRLIRRVSKLTGADVAASIDQTGNRQRGANWQLEATTGTIEARLPFRTKALSAYTGVLDTGDGLRAQYFNNSNFTDLRLTRVDPTVDFDWGRGSPAVGIGRDRFSVRWTGQLQADFTETYTFHTRADDQARLWVNGQLVVDSSNTRRGREASGTIRLNAGQRYDIRLDYVENNADASMQLLWSSASQGRQVIPRSRLFSTVPQNPGTISLATSTPPNVSEEAGTVALTVIRTGGSSGAVTVSFSVDDRTATAGSDYIDIPNGSLTFQDGETSKTIAIGLINDDVFEPDEEFTIGLLGTNGVGQVGTPRTATVRIVDDDSPSTVSFSQPTYSTNENGGTAFVTVQRAGNLNRSATIEYATSNGTAIAGADYTATVGTLSFASGETSKTIAIPITNDTLVEQSETVNLTLRNPGRWTTLGSQAAASLTIVDNDPGTFTRQTVASGLNQPTTIDWTPDGAMLIAQKDGVVRVVRNGQLQSSPFIDLSGRVNGTRDRGLLGMAVHPNASTPYVYLLYTYDPPQAGNNINPGTDLDDRDGAGNRPAQLLRVTATTDGAGNLTAVAGSEVVLLGENSLWEYTSRPDGNSTNDGSIPPSGIRNTTNLANVPDSALDIDANGNLTNNIRDYIATDSESHTIGAVHFGQDGALYVSIGDGTSYNFADPRTVRVQDLNNLSGKILRIDPMTGNGLPDNPFYSAIGGADNNRDKVFNYGTRNPFRFAIDPVTGYPVVGDVGWTAWEEINTGRGVNFGWPYYEGGSGVSLRQGTGYGSLPETQAFYANNGDQQVTAPIYAQNHADGAIAIVMGDFYDRDNLIFGDVGNGNIYQATLNADRRVTDVRLFDSNVGGVVDIERGADGQLYGVNLWAGTIFRWTPQ